MVAGDCLWIIYYSVFHMTSPLRVLENEPPNSASATEDMPFLELQRWRVLIHCAYLYLNAFVHFLNRNSLQLCFLLLVLKGMMCRYVCEVSF